MSQGALPLWYLRGSFSVKNKNTLPLLLLLPPLPPPPYCHPWCFNPIRDARLVILQPPPAPFHLSCNSSNGSLPTIARVMSSLWQSLAPVELEMRHSTDWLYTHKLIGCSHQTCPWVFPVRSPPKCSSPCKISPPASKGKSLALKSWGSLDSMKT